MGHEDMRSHSHTGPGEPSLQHDAKRMLVAACLAAGAMALQAVGGIAAGSLALLAGAGLMLGGVVGRLLDLHALRSGGQNRATLRAASFERAGALAIYTAGLVMAGIGAWAVYAAFHRLAEPVPVLAAPMLAIAVAAALCNVAALRIRNAAAGPALIDVLSPAAAACVAILMLPTDWWWMDAMLAVLAAVLLFHRAGLLLLEAGRSLLSGASPAFDSESIARDIETNVDGVVSIRHLHVWSLDGARNLATLHACLRDGADAHAAMCDIKLRLARHHHIEHVTVEPEFGQHAERPAQRHLH